MEAYFDNSATTRVYDEVAEAVLRAMTTESLAYLNYLRRFAHGDKEAENG